MRLAAGPDRPALAHTLDVVDVDGIPARRITCTVDGCGWCAEGSAAWVFGIVDEATHVYALRCTLARDCSRGDCPHDIEPVPHR